MADFSNIEQMMRDLQGSLGILNLLRDVYSTCTRVEELLARYQTDPVFTIQVDHVYSLDQLAELAVMVGDVQTLRSNWLTNHEQLLNIGGII